MIVKDFFINMCACDFACVNGDNNKSMKRWLEITNKVTLIFPHAQVRESISGEQETKLWNLIFEIGW